MKRIPKQEYTAQLKDQGVAIVKGGKTVAEAARAKGLVEQTLRNWVKLAAKGKLHEGAKGITLEQMELCYCARPPFALERLEQVRDHQFVYR